MAAIRFISLAFCFLLALQPARASFLQSPEFDVSHITAEARRECDVVATTFQVRGRCWRRPEPLLIDYFKKGGLLFDDHFYELRFVPVYGSVTPAEIVLNNQDRITIAANSTENVTVGFYGRSFSVRVSVLGPFAFQGLALWRWATSKEIPPRPYGWCPPGRYFNASEQCTPCEPGTHKVTHGTHNCTRAPHVASMDPPSGSVIRLGRELRAPPPIVMRFSEDVRLTSAFAEPSVTVALGGTMLSPFGTAYQVSMPSQHEVAVVVLASVMLLQNASTLTVTVPASTAVATLSGSLELGAEAVASYLITYDVSFPSFVVGAAPSANATPPVVFDGASESLDSADDSNRTYLAGQDPNAFLPPPLPRTICTGRTFTCALTALETAVECFGTEPTGGDVLTNIPASLTHPIELHCDPDGEIVCARQLDGRVRCWGSLTSPLVTFVPTDSLSLFHMSSTHSVAIKARDGSFMTWVTSSSQNDLLNVPPHTHGRFRDVCAGRGFTCALTRENGTVACWGREFWRPDKAAAGPAPPSPDDASKAGNDRIFCGREYVCVQRALNGSLFCFGAPTSNQLEAPDKAFARVSLREEAGCGVDANTGFVECWGEMVSAPPSFGTRITELRLGAGSGKHYCARDRSGSLMCGYFANNNEGQASVPQHLRAVVQVSAANNDFSCALDRAGRTTCFGSIVTIQDRPPSEALGAVSVGFDSACGIFSGNDSVVCWGPQTSGSPAVGYPTDTDIAMVSTARSHACALHFNGGLSCWGDPAADYSPIMDMPTDQIFVSVSCYDVHVCALSYQSEIVCWGTSFNGETTPPHGEVFRSVDVGYRLTCALRANTSEGLCWGRSVHGIDTPPPGQIVELETGRDHTCAVMRDATVSCKGLTGLPTSDIFIANATRTIERVTVAEQVWCVITSYQVVFCAGSNGQGEATPPSSMLFESDCPPHLTRASLASMSVAVFVTQSGGSDCRQPMAVFVPMDTLTGTSSSVPARAFDIVLSSFLSFTDNEVRVSGGSVTGSTVQALRSSLVFRDVTFDVMEDGTAIEALASTLTFINCTFRTTQGSALRVINAVSSHIAFYRCTFDAISVVLEGVRAQLDGALFVMDSTFSDCSSETRSPFLDVRSSSQLLVHGTTFESSGDAQSFVLASESRAALSSTTVRGGALRVEGGVWFVLSSVLDSSRMTLTSATTAVIHRSWLVRSTAFPTATGSACFLQSPNGGGAVRVESALVVLLSESTLSDNAATGSCGGAISVEAGSPINVSSCVFERNTASFGGALCLMGAETASVTSTHFTANNATLYGGAIFFASDSQQLHVRGGSFRSNRAILDGGAVFCSASAGVAFIAGSMFELNEAESGGGGGIYGPHSATGVAWGAGNTAVYGSESTLGIQTLNVTATPTQAVNVRESLGQMRVAFFDDANGARVRPYTGLGALIEGARAIRGVSVVVSSPTATIFGANQAAIDANGEADLGTISLAAHAGEHTLVFEATTPECDAFADTKLTLSVNLTLNPCDLGTVFIKSDGICQKCAAGTKGTAGGCESCTGGSFSNDTSLTRCFDCPLGKASATIGAVACQPTEPGFFANDTGLTKALKCPVGSFSEAAAVHACIECPPGSSSGAGAVACSPCRNGTRAPAWGSSTCAECAPGSFSYANATACELCAAGHYTELSGSTRCFPARLGFFVKDAAAAGSPCEAGTFSNVTAATACRNCSAGWSSTAGSSACALCEPGTYQPVSGGSVCLECGTGEYSPGGVASCAACDEGEYAPFARSSACTPCPAGSFGNRTGLDACELCTAGTYANTSGLSSCIPCPEGSDASALTVGAVSCTLCPAGTTATATGCATCLAGSFSNDTGLTRCFDCPRGSFAALDGLVGCNPCPAGRFANVSGLAECWACVSGTKGPTTGLTRCEPCPVGSDSTSNTESGTVDCVLCPAGTKTTGSGCEACPPGTFSNTSGLTRCFDCPHGSFASLDGSVGCVPCNPGRFANDTGRITCPPCAEGTHAPNRSSTVCVACTPGRFSGEAAAVCSVCVSGTASEVGAPSCTPCDRGHFSLRGARNCSKCAPGTYGPTVGSSECTNAGSGFYVSGWGATEPTPCPEGTLSQTSTATFCEPCPAGTAAANRSDTCRSCTPGRFSDPRSGECEPCALGHTAPESNAASCVPCERPRYQNKAGQASCDACPNGRYAVFRLNDPLLLDGCAECPDGATCDAGVVTIKAGHFAVADNATGAVTTVPCATYRCEEGGRCGPNRLPASENPLCGRCREGYAEWGGDCVPCESSRIGPVMALFLLLWVVVVLYHAISQISTGSLRIMVYFWQMLFVFISTRTWLDWAAFLNFDLLSITGSSCLLAISPLAKLRFALFVPLSSYGFVALTALLHLICTYVASSPPARQVEPTQKMALPAVDATGAYRRAIPRLREFSWRAYMRTALCLYIFTYNVVTDSVFAAFNCVSVQGVRYVVTSPAISCDDPDFKTFQAGAAFVGVIYLVVAPAALTFVLVRRREHLLNVRFRQVFGCLFEPFTQRYYYWGLLTLARRAVLVGVAVFVWRDRTLMFGLLTMLNVTFLSAQLVLEPFGEGGDNAWEGRSLGALAFVTVMLTMWAGEDQGELEGSKEVLLAVLCLAVGVVLIARTVMFKARHLCAAKEVPADPIAAVVTSSMDASMDQPEFTPSRDRMIEMEETEGKQSSQLGSPLS